MKDSGAERVIDTFRFQHHAIPVPHITATDRIIVAARRLADAIKGVQEAPSDELAAIASLRHLLLGEALPPDPTPAVTTSTGNHFNLPTDDERPATSRPFLCGIRWPSTRIQYEQLPFPRRRW